MLNSTAFSRRFIPALLVAILATLNLGCPGPDNGGGITTPDNPSIELSNAVLSFIGAEGEPAPTSQTIEVTSGGEGTLDGLSSNVSYTAGQPLGWLTATLSSTTAPSTLTLTATPGSLIAGTYTATVAVSSALAENSPQTISITYTLEPAAGGAPLITLSSTSQSFTAPQGGANPPGQTVNVDNGGDGVLDGLAATVAYNAGQPAGWLSATLSATAAPSTLTLQATTGTLPAGTYTASVAVTSAAAGNSPQSVNVTFTVAPPTAGPLIALSNTSRSFSATEGGANPAARTVQVTNGGGGSLSGLAASVSYTAGQPSGWLTAALSSSTAPSTLTLTATTGSLAAGTYTASVAVTSAAAGNSPQTVNVTFTVAAGAAAPAISLSNTTASFSATQGGSDPAGQTIQVTNGGGGSLSGLAANVSYTAGQPSGWLTASLSSTTAPSTLTLTATTGSLAAGTYTASVAVTSSVAGNSPQAVSVSFTITSPAPTPLIALSPTSTSFSATQGGANPASQTVAVTNGGGGTLSGLGGSISYASGEPTGWLSGDLSSATAPSTLTLNVVTGSLPAGTYTASVAVTSSVAGNSPQAVSVTLTVNAPTEVSRTFLASADNLLMNNSADASRANAVFRTSELAVGTSYFYTAFGTFDYIQTASLMKFDIQPTIAGKTILEATLSLYQYDIPGDFSGRFRLNAIVESWSPTSITWNRWLTMHYRSEGQINFEAIASTVAPLEFDVTSIVQSWANGTYPNNGFQIWEPNPVPPGSESYQATTIQSMDVYSSSARRPQLFIRYR